MVVMGVLFLVKPKYGNFSRSIGLLFVALAGFHLAHDLFLSEGRAQWLLLSTTVAAAFVLCGIECLRRRGVHVAMLPLGITSILIGFVCQAAGVWWFNYLKGVRPIKF